MTFSKHPSEISEIVLGERPPTIEEFVAVSRYRAKVAFDRTFETRVAASRRLVERFLDEERLVYGVTTGFGDNVRHAIPSKDSDRLQLNIVRSHAVSVGTPLEREQVRAIQLMMLISLGKGYSGVRLELLELIAGLLNNDVVPFAPGEGSVGYLAVEGHIALVLIGEGKARIGTGELMDGLAALKQAGLKPIELRCKEGLALLNGTTSVTGLAALALYNASQCIELADLTAALGLEVLKGTIKAFEPQVSQCQSPLWPTLRAKPISCVTQMIVMPSSARSVIVSRTSLTISGSSDDVGSSNSMMFGWTQSDRAIATRCCCPPESWAGYFAA